MHCHHPSVARRGFRIRVGVLARPFHLQRSYSYGIKDSRRRGFVRFNGRIRRRK